MAQHFIICLLVLATSLGASNAFAEQKVIDVVFARDVVNREPVNPFKPPAYCEKQAEPSRPVPLIDSETERKVYFWNQISSSAAIALRHTWYKNGVKVAEVNLRAKASPGFRTWSSKKIIPKLHKGKWKVVLSTIDDSAGVLCAAHFIVK